MTRYIFDLDRAIELGILKPFSPEPQPEDSPGDSPEPAAAEPERWQRTSVLAQAWLRFLDLLPYSGARSVGQREVLQFIKDNSGVKLHAISDHFKVTPNAISGIINGGLKRNIKKAGFPKVESVLRLAKEAGSWRYYAGLELEAQRPPIPLRPPTGSKPKK